jgi:hypothetical protein
MAIYTLSKTGEEVDAILCGSVRFDADQGLSPDQQAKARANIGAGTVKSVGGNKPTAAGAVTLKTLTISSNTDSKTYNGSKDIDFTKIINSMIDDKLAEISNAEGVSF